MQTTRQKFNLILTLAVMLTMAQTTWADDVTVTWPMDGTGNSADTRYDSEGKKAIVLSKYVWSNSSRTHKTYIQNVGGNIELGKYNVEISFPDIKGTITSITLNNVSFTDQDGGKLCLYAGTDMDNLLRTGDNQNYYQSMAEGSTIRNLSYTGSVEATESATLKLMFRHAQGTSSSSFDYFGFINGSIVVTYTPEAQQDTGHRFSYSISTDGASLTAECTANHTCDIPNRKATVTLDIEDMSLEEFYRNPYKFDISEFKRLTGLEPACSVITYTNKTTGESSTGKLDEGSYTASVTITIDETSYTLNKDFNLLEGFKVNNSYSQLSVSPRTALEGDEVTITYTQQMDENLEGLTLTGATSGNNIAYTQSDNTYTFTMPTEDVNINATITYPLNENNITQSGDTYTIKTAEGWNYFCRRMEVDGELDGFSGKTVELAANISVTTMAGTVHPFKGTFDGKGKTLTFNRIADAIYTAPFQNTDGATICNFHVEGTITGGNNSYLGGLVGSANGKLTIENCRVSTQISSTFDSNTLSANVGIGGFVGLLSSQYNQCHITGCVFDGLIYNPNHSGTTYGCGGFVGCFSEYGYAILEDCLFIEGHYDNNGSKHELLWGHDNNMNSTFFHRTNYQGSGKLTNCFFVATHFLKQGSPAVESATAPTNFAHFGNPTDHCFMQTYGHTMVFNNKYYTPTYGDLVEHYDYSGVKSYIIEYDDAPLGIPDIASPLWTESLRYNRSFTAGKPVTIMLPFNFTRNRITLAGSNENPSGKFYEFKGIRLDVNESNKWVAVMIEAGETLSNEVVENTLQANHPYLYVPGESTEHWAMYVSGGINIFTEGNEGGEKQTEYDGSNESYSWNKWNFKGTYQPRYWSDSENPEEIGKVYGFAGKTKEVDEQIVVAGDFVRAKSGAKIRPTSCYLMWTGYEPDPDPNAAPARRMTRGAAADEEMPQRITVKLVSASGETTAIGTLDTKTGEMTFDSEAWYTLDGVRLSGKPTKKGIYINNGKKVVIK
jgi:hypothetical protein